MRFDDIEKIVQDMSDRMIEYGVSREAVSRLAKDAQMAAIKDLIETHEDMRLLELFDQVGADGVAERHGVPLRTVYRRRQDAIDRISAKTVPNMAGILAEKAA